MGFKDEWYKTFTNHGLPDNTGNPLTEYGTGLQIMRLRGELSAADVSMFAAVVEKMTIGPELIYYKKLDGDGAPVLDELTKDDLVGVVAGSTACGLTYHDNIVSYGNRNGWAFSNTGKPYPSAYARPWDIATYKLSTGLVRPSAWELISLAAQLVYDAHTTKLNDPSSKRLAWLGIISMHEVPTLLAPFVNHWERKLNERYGGIRGVFSAFHGKDHVFARYAL